MPLDASTPLATIVTVITKDINSIAAKDVVTSEDARKLTSYGDFLFDIDKENTKQAPKTISNTDPTTLVIGLLEDGTVDKATVMKYLKDHK